ncbi:acyl-CoA dehydrogenase family protein [Streptomyces sp. DSM 44915]|uniref:Acyl-CoA dehydrogenase family protein n=1 Tax=Streptomyces chisholmiae TaxID=3075540 RepID=A0ABU2JV14_9ACTN|nr:acyl-CoA dehydrogenase family protein [Streptomyces sp. DSM 44915]MDT0268058.1 acyl-CoA dehydrogenase family protein [Streptomyces sp. DSM 44915]
MRTLQAERQTLGELLPDFSAALGQATLRELEEENGHAIRLFKRTGGPRLLVPAAQGGLGASAAQSVRVQRAIGSIAPSLAIATTMHHFSVASLVETGAEDTGPLLKAVGTRNMLLASGFAEGVTGISVMKPALTATRSRDGYRLNGTKKPCSLARSMDMLTASVVLEEDGGPQVAVALVLASSDGLTVEPFWGAPVLRAAESDAVVLKDVEVAGEQLVRIGTPDEASVDRVQHAGFLWFELLMSASYLGIASGLVEGVLEKGRGEPTERVLLLARLEAAMAGLDSIARAIDAGTPAAELLTRALLIRYQAQEAIGTTVNAATALLGGMPFISGDPRVHLFAEATRCLAFHPPSLGRAAQPILDTLTGEPLRLV